MTGAHRKGTPNLDERMVAGFGDEWSRFSQTKVPQQELAETFAQYFSVFPWDDLPEDAAGFDLGCGSGRWASFVAPRIASLHCVDASGEALAVARRNLEQYDNVVFHQRSVDHLPFADGSMDFGYSLGVLHHVPATEAGIQACVRKLKPGAPLLVYLYYAFDDAPGWFRALWRVSDLGRQLVSRMRVGPRAAVAAVIAAAVYLPLARVARLLERRGRDVKRFPLSFYRHRSFYTMRTDALDRFGTPLEQRFSREEIAGMMCRAGLKEVVFSEEPPFWCAVGRRG